MLQAVAFSSRVLVRMANTCNKRARHKEGDR
jgi:hypothetical protein